MLRAASKSANLKTRPGPDNQNNAPVGIRSLAVTVAVAIVVSNIVDRFLSCISFNGGVECTYVTV